MTTTRKEAEYKQSLKEARGQLAALRKVADPVLLKLMVEWGPLDKTQLADTQHRILSKLLSLVSNTEGVARAHDREVRADAIRTCALDAISTMNAPMGDGDNGYLVTVGWLRKYADRLEQE